LASVLYLTANILCITIPLSADIATRSAIMLLINIILLLCSLRLLFITELLGISRRAYVRFHKWFSVAAITQVIVHSIILALNIHPFQ
jgi:predicted ferric reductase